MKEVGGENKRIERGKEQREKAERVMGQRKELREDEEKRQSTERKILFRRLLESV